VKNSKNMAVFGSILVVFCVHLDARKSAGGDGGVAEVGGKARE
jgi:hypothetical protein